MLKALSPTQKSPVSRKRISKEEFQLPIIIQDDIKKHNLLSDAAQNWKIEENSHYLTPFRNLDKQFRKSHKGRKRRLFLEAKNFKEFIETKVVPNWEKYLSSIS